MIPPGDKLPPFRLPDATGTERDLASLAGPKGLVLYAYPKDDTPGCTIEAQDFRDLAPRFAALGYGVAGLSRDSVKSHCSFRDKYGLNFPLLSDPERVLLEAIGAWREKKMYGKATLGIVRSTVIVAPDGTVSRVYDNVKAKGHAERVLADLGG